MDELHSNESGRTHVYVSPFPNAQENRWSVSGRDGGAGPEWRGDGGEIFYQTAGAGGKLMAVPVTVKGNSLEMGTPRELFTRQSGVTPESLAMVSGSSCRSRPITRTTTPRSLSSSTG